MIYVVTGHMRHGTSAMMAALIAGGMDAYYDRERMRRLDAQTRARGDAYRLNPEVYEPGPDDFRRIDFPRYLDGRLIKVLWGGLPRLAPHALGYRYVMMQRHPEEARQSHEAGFAPQRATGAPFLNSEDSYDAHFKMVEELLAIRRDTASVTRVRFREELVADPLATFERLRADGWPVDPADAASAIDPARVRFKVEELEVGV